MFSQKFAKAASVKRGLLAICFSLEVVQTQNGEKNLGRACLGLKNPKEKNVPN